MRTLLAPNLKERVDNLREDAYIANAKEDAIYCCPKLEGASRVWQQFGDNLKSIYVI